MFYRGHTYFILPLLFCSYSTHTSDPATTGLLTRVLQAASPYMLSAAGVFGIKWHQQQTLSQDRVDMPNLPQNIDVLTKEAGGKIVAPPIVQPTVEVIAPQPQPKSTGGVIVGSTGTHKQFLKPGEQQPQFNNPGTPGQPYANRPGTLGHQSTFGDTNVSVSTNGSSVFNLIKDLGNVLSGDRDTSKPPIFPVNFEELQRNNTIEHRLQQEKVLGEQSKELYVKIGQEIAENKKRGIKVNSTTSIDSNWTIERYREYLDAGGDPNKSLPKPIKELPQEYVTPKVGDYTGVSKETLCGYQQKANDAVAYNEQKLKELAGSSNAHMIDVHTKSLDHSKKVLNAVETEIHKQSIKQGIITTGASSLVMNTQTAPVTPSATGSKLAHVDTKKMEELGNEALAESAPQKPVATEQTMPFGSTMFTDHPTMMERGAAGAAGGVVVAGGLKVAGDLLKMEEFPSDKYLTPVPRVAAGTYIAGLATTGGAVMLGQAIAPGVSLPYTGPAFIAACKYCAGAGVVSAVTVTGYTAGNVIGYAISDDPTMKIYETHKEVRERLARWDLANNNQLNEKILDEQYFNSLNTIKSEQLEKVNFRRPKGRGLAEEYIKIDVFSELFGSINYCSELFY